MIPKTIKVLGRKFTVTVVDRDKPLPDGGVAGDTSGVTHLDRETIHLYGDVKLQSAMTVRDTFLHEALHAIVYLGRLSVYLKDPDDEKEKIKDEAFVAAFAPQLLAFLRDNPKALAYLTEPVK